MASSADEALVQAFLKQQNAQLPFTSVFPSPPAPPSLQNGSIPGQSPSTPVAERRRKRERERARLCRQRKQQKVTSLEEEVQRLQAENNRLKEEARLTRVDVLNNNLQQTLLAVRCAIAEGRDEDIGDLMTQMNTYLLRIILVIRRFTETVPVLIDTAYFRNAILWSLMCPLEALLPHEEGQLPSEVEEKVKELDGKFHEVGEQLRQELSQAIQLKPDQAEVFVRFQKQWSSSILRTFKRNRKVAELLTQLHAERDSILMFQTLISSVQHRFNTRLTPRQRSLVFMWLDNHKEALMLLGNVSDQPDETKQNS